MKRSKSKRDLQREKMWREEIGDLKRSGLSAAQFCSRRGINLSTFYSWGKEVRKRDRETGNGKKRLSPIKVQKAFVPVKVAELVEGKKLSAFDCGRDMIDSVDIVLRSGHIVRLGKLDYESLCRLLSRLESH